MPRICYTPRNFRGAALDTIERVNAICEEYRSQGYDLTLRQVYYQFVARGFIPNNDREYNNLGEVINAGRLAGLIDWDYITDRTRNVRENPHWAAPQDIIEAARRSYANDKWRLQRVRPEVWVEKDALAGVVGQIAQRLDVPYFSCRGYTSQSELWAAGQRMVRHIRDGFIPLVLHLGDHDPSGLDMTRDITDRLTLFAGKHISRARMLHGTGQANVERLADGIATRHFGTGEYASMLAVVRLGLNMDQVRRYAPPPNPAKMSDGRARAYVAEHGSESWELDALEPSVLSDLISDAVLAVRDEPAWREAERIEREGREALEAIRRGFDAAVEAARGAA